MNNFINIGIGLIIRIAIAVVKKLPEAIASKFLDVVSGLFPKSSSNLDMRLRKAKQLLDKGYKERAKDMYNNLLFENIDNKFVATKAHVGRGRIYVKEENIDRAIQEAEEALTLNKENGEAYLVCGMAYSLSGKYDEALKDFIESLEHTLTDKGEAFRLRGDEYTRMGQYDIAINDYANALKIKKKDAAAFASLGLVYYIMRDYDPAIENYTLAIRINPKDASNYTFRGAMYYIKGDIEKAVADYTMAFRLDPNDANIKQCLELAQKKRGYYGRIKVFGSRTYGSACLKEKKEKEKMAKGKGSLRHRTIIQFIFNNATYTLEKLNRKDFAGNNRIRLTGGNVNRNNRSKRPFLAEELMPYIIRNYPTHNMGPNVPPFNPTPQEVEYFINVAYPQSRADNNEWKNTYGLGCIVFEFLSRQAVQNGVVIL
ncbi:hypothetical protein FACS189445_1910 [Spirochaetia bacterium]|nr:hypothetical protein FACS189445_1910 [Spirochaetia bacterium]